MVTASLTCCRVRVVLKSLLEKPSLLRIPSMRKPRLAVEEIVSLHTMYLMKRQKQKRHTVLEEDFVCAGAGLGITQTR